MSAHRIFTHSYHRLEPSALEPSSAFYGHESFFSELNLGLNDKRLEAHLVCRMIGRPSMKPQALQVVYLHDVEIWGIHRDQVSQYTIQPVAGRAEIPEKVSGLRAGVSACRLHRPEPSSLEPSTTLYWEVT